MSRPSTLMVAALGARVDEESARYCLAIRFCGVNDVARMERLMITQIRRRFTQYRDLKPKAIRAVVEFHVYEVPAGKPPKAGWPKWLGEAGWFK